MSLGSKLREARERYGLSQQEVHRSTTIGVSSLSEFEKDKREPSLSQLKELAGVYQRPITYFLSEETVPQETVLWRKRPAQNAERIEAEFLELCRKYRNLERWCGEVVSPELPQVTPPETRFEFKDAKDLARRVRNELNLGDRPGFSLRSVLEDRCGIKIFHQAFEPTGTAAAVKSTRYGWGILLNAQTSSARRTFDLAHELFHLLTWEVFAHDAEQTPGTATDDEECFADAFASSLLMPQEEMECAIEKRRHDGNLPLSSVVSIAQQFQVSPEAVLWRIHCLYHRDREDTERVIRQLPATSWFEPLELDSSPEPTHLPRRYQELACRALYLGELSVSRFAEYLNISLQDALRCNEQDVLDVEIPLAAC